jgi:1-acyl-sn-glycerol-3-phosphate acyltransferase
MFLLLQVIVSLSLGLIYFYHLNFATELLVIFKVILLFIGVNIGMIIIILLLFLIFVYTTEKTSKTAMWKHKIYHHFNVYIFNVLYRVKPVIIGKENLPKNNNFVVYSNHIEYTDPLYIKQAYRDFPLAFVSKEELFKYPFMRNVLRGTGCISLSRKAGDRQALQAVLEAINSVKNGQPMGIFPEGTRSHSNTMQEFKSGSFKIAQKAQADISPIVLCNMHKTIDIFKLFKAKVYLRILPLIKYEEYKDMDTNKLSNYVFDKINDQLCTLKEIN